MVALKLLWRVYSIVLGDPQHCFGLCVQGSSMSQSSQGNTPRIFNCGGAALIVYVDQGQTQLVIGFISRQNKQRKSLDQVKSVKGPND